MHRLALLAAALVACGPLPEGDDFAGNSGEIINGSACADGEEPAVVALLIDATVDVPGQGSQAWKGLLCTGTLIAPDVVLVAAHCVEPQTLAPEGGSLKNLKFSVSGRRDLTAFATGTSTPPPLPTDAVAVTKWVRHPSFEIPSSSEGPGNWHDVALVFLARALPIQPAVLVTFAESPQIAAGHAVRIVGYGQQVQAHPFERAPDGLTGRQMCATTTLGEVGLFEMQVGGTGSSPRKCHGDSGGPTFMDVQAGTKEKRRIVGITSHSYDDADCGKGGIDTRVDAVRTWIDGELLKGCNTGSRVWCEFAGAIPPEWWEEHGPPRVTPPARKGCGCTGLDATVLAALGLLARRRRQPRGITQESGI